MKTDRRQKGMITDKQKKSSPSLSPEWCSLPGGCEMRQCSLAEGQRKLWRKQARAFVTWSWTLAWCQQSPGSQRCSHEQKNVFAKMLQMVLLRFAHLRARAQLAKCFLCKHKDPSSIPRIHIKNLGMMLSMVLVQLVSYSSVRKPVSKKKCGLYLRNNIQGFPLVSTHLCTHTHTHLHTCTCMYNCTHMHTQK